MSKRKKIKRAYLRRYASDYINVYQGPNLAKIGEYHDSVKSIKGPKNDAEPLLENSWCRPMVNGIAGTIKCSCGKGPFWTTIQFQQHLKKFSIKEQQENHLPDFIPDMKKGHYALDNSGKEAVYYNHKWMDTPLREKNFKISQSKRQISIQQYSWIEILKVPSMTVCLGFVGTNSWKLKKRYPDGRERFSRTYSDRAAAMIAWQRGQVEWE